MTGSRSSPWWNDEFLDAPIRVRGAAFHQGELFEPVNDPCQVGRIAAKLLAEPAHRLGLIRVEIQQGHRVPGGETFGGSRLEHPLPVREHECYEELPRLASRLGGTTFFSHGAILGRGG